MMNILHKTRDIFTKGNILKSLPQNGGQRENTFSDFLSTDNVSTDSISTNTDAGAKENAKAQPEPIIHSDFEDYFRKTCCVFPDGTYWYAKSYHTDKKLLDLIAKYRHAGLIPKEISYRAVSLQEIARLYENTALQEKGESKFLFSLLEQCANARASDFIIKVRPQSGHFIALVNDLEYELADPRLPEVSADLISLLFHNKDIGSNHDGLSLGKNQGFSVSDGDFIKLPKNISKLRAERGPNFPGGQHCVARIFYKNTLSGEPDLRKLGLSEEFATILEKVSSSGRGFVCIAAPTGEGKSTTLATTLRWIVVYTNGQRRIVSLEDPPEYIIEGVTQMAVSNAADGEERGQKFKEALNSFVRVNPATGMIGEIRDQYSAEQALAMVRTGHQIFTTIHETSANAILFRMMWEFGVLPAQISNPQEISLLIRQTLTTILCPECCLKLEDLEVQPLKSILSEMQYTPATRFKNPKGCKACHRGSEGSVDRKSWIGYSSKKAIAEWIVPDQTYLNFVKNQDEMGAYNYWINDMGGKTIHAQVSEMVHAGKVDPRDARFKGIIIQPDTASKPKLDLITGDAE